MSLAFVNGRILLPEGFVEGRAVVIEHNRISAITDEGEALHSQATCVDLAGRQLLPGFIDVQVNGGGGVLFNDFPTVDGIRSIAAAHARFGTTGFLPTLISDDAATTARAIAAVEAAMAADVPGVLGIHIEGPHLNQARKGIHDAAHFQQLDEQAADLLCSLRTGVTVLTFAPERADLSALDKLKAAGVILAAGHTDATAAEISAAKQHGLSGFTHLFNAMSQMSAREPGAVGAALGDDDSYCGIIVDGKHVDSRVLKVALRAKRHDRFMLVTDAMPSVGTSLVGFMLQGRPIRVVGDYCVDEQGTLAGTALNMSRAVKNAVSMLGLPPAEAIRMASEYPAQFLGLGATHGRIAPGFRADFVVADNAGEILETWIGGQRIVH